MRHAAAVWERAHARGLCLVAMPLTRACNAPGRGRVCGCVSVPPSVRPRTAPAMGGVLALRLRRRVHAEGLGMANIGLHAGGGGGGGGAWWSQTTAVRCATGLYKGSRSRTEGRAPPSKRAEQGPNTPYLLQVSMRKKIRRLHHHL